MLFSSITFLYVFLPGIVLLYYLAPKKIRNYVLLLASLLFYAWGEPKYVLLMLGEIRTGYLFGLLIGQYHTKAPAKFLLGASLFVNIGLLGFFKYTDFFMETFGQVTGLPVQLFHIALPIGISFYTFQIMSYTIDVYRGDVPAQKNPFILATYVAMFPQLIAGPIVRYSDVEKQLTGRTYSFDKAAAGVQRFLLGLGKKVLIANALGELCDIFRASTDLSVTYYWMYAVAFTLHIYFDFSGYSDMAIGLGKILGFELLENFNYPYISKSITEFWRRWHISLGSWFRDYVYIPMGGNRVSKAKWFRNILVVWFLTGFWHGAAWNFIVWGMFFAIFLLLEKRFYGQALQKAKFLNHLYVILLIIISFVIFHASDMSQAVSDIACMFGFGRLPFISGETTYYFGSYGFIFIIAILGATPFPKQIIQKVARTKVGERLSIVIEPLVLLSLLIVITAYLVDGSFNPFLYFRF